MKNDFSCDISIIIVNYNSGSFLYECLKSIIETLTVDYEVIVVDNHSSDDSMQRCRPFESEVIQLIFSEENCGFSKANNIGVKRSGGRILHFLNPDTRVTPDLNADYRKVMNRYADGTEGVYINPMRNRDGAIEFGKNYLPLPMNYLKYLFCRDKALYYYIGATVIIPRGAFDKIGGWNELFFMYEEDMELFYRIHQFGLPVFEFPAVIEHYGGACSEKTWSSFERELLIQKSFKLFYVFYRSLPEYWLMQLFIVCSFIRRPKRAWWQMKVIWDCNRNYR